MYEINNKSTQFLRVNKVTTTSKNYHLLLSFFHELWDQRPLANCFSRVRLPPGPLSSNSLQQVFFTLHSWCL